MKDAGISRNHLKVYAAIQALRKEDGSFKGWVDRHHPQTLENWVKLFKREFVFTGREVINEFLMSTGYLPGFNSVDWPIDEVVLAS